MQLPELKSQKPHPKLPFVLSLSGLLVAAVVIAVVGVSTSGLTGPAGAAGAAVYAAPAGVQDELQIQLSGDGFSPSEVQHAAGTFAIAVENSNVSGAYTLRLKAADGTVVKEVQVQKGSAAWTVTLSAGEYTLTEASHPQWLCRIIVQ